MLQRFLFLVLKPFIEASSTGLKHGSTFIFPRLLMVCCDQKQERPFLGLKSAGGTRDCSFCDMMSKLTQAEWSNFQFTSQRSPSNPPSPSRPRARSISPSSSRRSVGNDSADNHSKHHRRRSRSAVRRPQSRNIPPPSTPHNSRHISSQTSNSSATSDDSDDSTESNSITASQARQLDPAPGQKRSVVRMLSAQLTMAVANIVRGGAANRMVVQKLRHTLDPHWFDRSEEELCAIRHYLMTHSGCDLPPALAAVHGLGTHPFLLYETIGFDSLHVLDSGIIRLFADKCVQHFSGKKYTTLPTSRSISLANERLNRMPRSCHLPNVDIFASKNNERQPGMTGLVRRQTCPFLWVCVLGLNSKVSPDNDPLVQAALELDFIHSELLGTNAPVQAMHCSQSWIQQLQSRAFALGVQFVELFDISISTKLHRVMRHLESHLTSFGMLRWGANDGNEKLHKLLKAAYLFSNKKPKELAVQLVNTGYANTSDILNSEDNNDAHPNLQETSSHHHLCAAMSVTVPILNSNDTITSRIEAISNLKYTSRKAVVWTAVSYITVDINLPWSTDIRHQYVTEQFTFRGWCTNSHDVRMDGCVYSLDGSSMQGFIQKIIRLNRFRNNTFVVIRRLKPAQSDPGNTFPSDRYGHRRFQCAVTEHGRVVLDLVPIASIQYPLFLLMDPTVLAENIGIYATDVSAMECDEHLTKSRFFAIRTVSLTSFRESVSGEADPTYNN